jgi:hypothetical protein
MVDQACPLCHQSAVYEEVNFGNWKQFRCARCIVFRISKDAESRLAQSPMRWKWSADLSRRARKAPDKHVLVITLSSGADGTNSVFDTKYVPLLDPAPE